MSPSAGVAAVWQKGGGCADRMERIVQRLRSCDRLWALRLVSIGFGLVVMAVSGTFYSFSAFGPAIKAQLNFTQSEINMQASTGYLGLNLVAIPAGLLYDRFSHRVMSATAAVVYGLGYMLMWGTLSHWIPPQPYLMAAFMFIMGAGMCLSYMNPMLTNIHNCPPSHRGLVLGLQDGFLGLSAVIFSSLYSVAFGIPADRPEEQNAAGFMLCLALVVAVVNALGLVCLRIVPFPPTDPLAAVRVTSGSDADADADADADKLISESGTTSARAATALATDSKSAAEVSTAPSHRSSTGSDAEHIGGLRLLRSLNFWLLFVLSFTVPGAALMYMNNVSFVLQSYGRGGDVPLHSILIPLSATASRLSCGVLSDAMLRRRGYSRVWFHAVPTFALLALQVLLIATAESVLVLASILAPFLFGAFWSITGVFISEEFGETHFGSNWGLLMLSPAASGFVFQAVSGFLYDRQVPPGETACYGPDCYRFAFVFCLALLVLSVPLVLLLLRRARTPKWAAVVALHGDKDRLLADDGGAEASSELRPVAVDNA